MMYVGWIGMIVMSLATVPQAIKVWRENSARGMAWSYLLLLMPGFVCMLIYCWSLPAWPQVASYVLQIVLFSTMIYRKVNDGKERSTRSSGARSKATVRPRASRIPS